MAEGGDVERTIIVQGIDSSITKEMLELFFENRKRSGGDEIQNIRIDQTTSTARITFSECGGKHARLHFSCF